VPAKAGARPALHWGHAGHHEACMQKSQLAASAQGGNMVHGIPGPSCHAVKHASREIEIYSRKIWKRAVHKAVIRRLTEVVIAADASSSFVSALSEQRLSRCTVA